MNRRHLLNEKAKRLLRGAIEALSNRSFYELEKLSEPSVPDFDFCIPAELSKYQFTLYKDKRPDGRIRVAVQMYRHRFLGIGQMWAQGFYVSPSGEIEWFTEEDTWEFT